MAAPERLPNRVLLFYGLPGLVTAIPTIPVFTLLPTYYAEQVGLGLVLTGLIIAAGRLFDVVSDPIVGWLADRDDGRHLRRLIIIGALAAAPALVLLLAPPPGAGGAWLFTTSVALYLGWTLVQIPYLTWGAQLSTAYHERTRITTAREGAVLIGILLSGSMPAILGAFGVEEARRFAMIGWGAVLIGLPSFVLLIRAVPPPAKRVHAPISWRGITRNRLFVRLLYSWFINSLANGIPAVLFPLYCAKVLGVDDQTRNMLLALYLGCALVGIPLWLYASRVLSKHRAWSLAMIITCPAFAIAAFLGEGQVAWFAFVCIATGLCLGADLALPPAIQADVADWDRLRFKRNRTAALFSLWNMASKLALAAAAGLTFPLLGSLGLQGPEPTPIALTWLAISYALVPCALKASAIWMMVDLPLTPRRQAAISSRLQRRCFAE